MAKKATTLHDNSGNELLPITNASITYMDDGNSVQSEINDLKIKTQYNKGHFNTPEALNLAYPPTNPDGTIISDDDSKSREGWYAIVGSTDTVWIWDVQGKEWVNSGAGASAVDSVNGLDGDVVLTGGNINATATIGTESSTKLINAHLNDVYSKLDNSVDLTSSQVITGTKVFTEVIGLANTSEGTVDQIKHINSNFLITSGTGQNLLNIDEGLETISAFNRELAYEDEIAEIQGNYVTNDTLSQEIQNVTDMIPTKVSELTNDSDYAKKSEIPNTSDFVTTSGIQTVTGGKYFSAGISTDLIQSSNSKNIISNISNNTYVGDTSSYLWLQSNYRPVVNENGSYYELAYSSDISGLVEKDSMYYYYKTKYDESVNLFNEDTHYHSGQAYDDGGNIVWWSGYTRFDDYIKVSPYTAYTLSINAETNIYITMCYYNGDLEFISDNNSHFGTFVTPENCEYIRFACGKLPSEIYYIMLNEGAVRLPYTKYNSNAHITNGQATLLKDEYEKTLNLFTYAGESITIHSGNEQWKEYRFSDFGLVEGETYTISSYDVPNGISLQLLDGYNNFANSKITFVYNSSNNRFRVGGNSVSQNTTFDLNVQIIKGTYTGGYHDFHGSILHYRDLGTLLWENGSSNSDFGEQQVTTLDRSKFRYIVVVYKNYKTDERAWQCQFFKNSKYYQNGSLFFVEVGYTKIRSFSFESSPTSVLFGNGYENGNQSNSQMIPVAIYGIK